MATILSRTIFYDNSDGKFRFHDWALVNTTLGAMLEPRVVVNPINNSSSGTVDRDYSDEWQRIDHMVPFSLDKRFLLIGNDEGKPLCGGQLMGRTGR
jgi:hypothetical protein